ncbi:PTS lactose/cellobiose transporter subunit IIA [Amedibacillus sp. YH-ame6]
MKKEDVQNVSFQIISFAGDAFADFYEAVEEAKKGRFEDAEKLMKHGGITMNEAHKVQTELLTCEASGKDIEFSIMMVHAQDHLMTSIMYERIAKQMIDICKKVEK